METPKTNLTFLCKVAFFGDCEVGKTSVAHRLLFDSFDPNYRPTIGVRVHEIDYQTNWTDDQLMRFRILDFSGQEIDEDRLDQLNDCFHCIIFYDLTSKTSYNNAINRWLEYAKRNMRNPKVLFVGTKNDICSSNIDIDYGHIAISAKTETSKELERIFHELLKE